MAAFPTNAPAPVMGNSNEGFSVGKPASNNYTNQIQRGAQQRMPYTPNNGNPRGANNMPRFSQSGFFMGMGAPRPNEVQPGGQVDKPGQYGYANDVYAQDQQQSDPMAQFRQILQMLQRGGGGFPQPQFGMEGRGNAGYFGGQAPGAGRYRPPMMDQQGGWQDFGGYNYNLPNAFGSYPGYGQGNPNSRFFGYGYGGMYGAPQPFWG